MVVFVSECGVKLFPKKLSVKWVEAPFRIMILRPTASFMVNRTQLKFINHLILRPQVLYARKIDYFESRNSRSCNIMVKEI